MDFSEMSVLAMLVLALSAWLLALIVPQKKDNTYQYRRHSRLLSNGELAFYKALSIAVGKDFQIFTKVRLADILAPQRGLDKSRWQSAFNAIRSKHIDFVLCSSKDLSIVAAIELDDVSHGNKKRISRDQFLGDAFSSAQLVLVRFKAKRQYSPRSIRVKIADEIKKKQIDM